MLVKRLNSRMQDFQEPTYFNKSQQNQSSVDQEWIEVNTSSNLMTKRAHHASVIVGQKMYVHGGYEAGGKGILRDFMCFSMQTKQWKSVLSENSTVGSRHSHSLVHWNMKLYLFGGIVNTFQSSNKVFSFQIGQNNKWREQVCKGQVPPALHSYRAVIWKEEMIVFGGQEQQSYNEYIYSLNLHTNEWKKVCRFIQQGVRPRSDFSMNLINDRLYIFGGRMEDTKYNQLWQYNLQTQLFKKLQTDIYLKPTARSGHSGCIYQGNLLIFGGTTGVTHQRNDLLIYNIKGNYWRRHWPDEQSQVLNERENQLNPRIVKKCRQNSIPKRPINTSFGPIGNEKLITEQSKVEKFSLINSRSSPKHKYREPMKQQNYYNQNYPFYGGKQTLSSSKFKKNDLLVDLEKETKQDLKQSHFGLRNRNKIQVHMSQTFQSINNVMPSTFQTGGKSDQLSSRNEEKVPKQISVKQPKSRDGHSCEIYENHMIIFGGDRHHMSFNDVVIVNFEKVINPSEKYIQKEKEKN